MRIKSLGFRIWGFRVSGFGIGEGLECRVHGSSSLILLGKGSRFLGFRSRCLGLGEIYSNVRICTYIHIHTFMYRYIMYTGMRNRQPVRKSQEPTHRAGNSMTSVNA